MDSTLTRCARAHVEDHHVRALRSLRVRAAQLQEDLERANARLVFVCDQLDSLTRDVEVAR